MSRMIFLLEARSMKTLLDGFERMFSSMQEVISTQEQ
jgi:hypothetical protein